MPALGYTITEEAIRHELATLEGGLPEFCRAYLNMWPDDLGDDEWVLPKPSWLACRDPATERTGAPVLAVDVSPNRSTSAVVFAATRADGLPMVQVVRHGDGAGWVAEHVGQIVADKGAAAVVIDGIGPVSSLEDDIREQVDGRCEVVVMNTGDVADACGSMFDAVVTEQLRHPGQPVLDDAVKGAAKRVLPGGRFAWDRRTSGCDITPLVAATAALWGLPKARDHDVAKSFY
jgi:hypothetical protein